MKLLGRIRDKLRGAKEMLAFDNSMELLLRRVFFRRTRILTYRIGELEFVVDHARGDANGTRACVASPMYRGFLPKLNLRGALTVLDIGANGGGFPLMLRACGFRIMKLMAVEMNPRTFARLQFNVTHNIDAELNLIHGAVAGEKALVRLRFGPGGTGDSLASARTATDGHGATIRVYTVDELIQIGFGDGRIDLCKIDIEGAEYDVFGAGNWRAIENCRFLVIEIHAVAGQSRDALVGRIESQGFEQIRSGLGMHRDVYCFRRVP